MKPFVELRGTVREIHGISFVAERVQVNLEQVVSILHNRHARTGQPLVTLRAVNGDVIEVEDEESIAALVREVPLVALNRKEDDDDRRTENQL